MFKRMFNRTTLIAGLIAAAALPFVIAAQTGRAADIDTFFRTFTDEWMRGNPSGATSSRYFSGDEQDRLERQLTPETEAYKRQRVQLAKRGLADLKKFDRRRMTAAQRLSADLMEWQLDTIVKGEPFLDYEFPLQQMNGVNINLVETMTVRHPVNTERDAENYIAALGQVSARLDEAIAEHGRIAQENIIPPTFILNATVRQMQEFVDVAPADNPFVSLFAQKLEAIGALSAARRQELKSQAEKVTASQIYPAWKRGIALLQSQLAKSTDEAGISKYKGGDAAYRYFLKRYTTTNLTPAQIHEIGLREVARIEGEMDAIFRKLGRSSGSVQQRIDKLSDDMSYPNPTAEPSRAQIMRDIDDVIRDAEKRSEALFDIRPKSRVVAQPFPTFREANAAANYNAPPADGSRPGVFQYPRRVNRMTKFGLRSVTYHETIPGHHFQIALQVENQSLPKFRQMRAFGGISAITEGWALYAERLAAESGWYGDDLEGQLGQLEASLFRARRLVVDTGLHAMHWTRQQAIDYGIEASEVERYVVFPGQACSYMIGQLKLVELREKARKALGQKFSIREYHNVVLQAGMVPLELLEREVDTWIRSL